MLELASPGALAAAIDLSLAPRDCSATGSYQFAYGHSKYCQRRCRMIACRVPAQYYCAAMSI